MKSIVTFAAALLLSVSAFAAEQNDSLSYYLGKSQGFAISKQIENNVALMPQFKDQFVEGLRAAFNADPSAIGYYDGLNMGLEMLKGLKQLEGLGATINRSDFINELCAAILTQNPDEASAKAAMERANQLIRPLAERAKAEEEAKQKAQQEQFDSICNANEAAGKAYGDSLLASNDGWKQTPEGLIYKVITKGKGVSPKPDQKVMASYKGTFPNGTVFDDSKGESIEFTRQGVIKGFGDGLGLMNKGAHYILFIPGKLAYGLRGAGGGKIGPNQALIFDVKLTDILK